MLHKLVELVSRADQIRGDLGLDPVQLRGDSGVHAGIVGDGAPLTEAHDADGVVTSVLRGKQGA